MRTQQCPWDRIAVFLELVVNGSPVDPSGSGGVIQAAVYRVSDGKWWDPADEEVWTTASADLTAGEVHADMPGVLRVPATAGSFVPGDRVLGRDGYVVTFWSDALGFTEHVFVEPAYNPLAEALDDYKDEAGTAGEGLYLMLGLRGSNVRVVYDTYATGGAPLTGTVYVYESAAALAADVDGDGTGSTHSFPFVGTADGVGRLATFVSTRA